LSLQSVYLAESSGGRELLDSQLLPMRSESSPTTLHVNDFFGLHSSGAEITGTISFDAVHATSTKNVPALLQHSDFRTFCESLVASRALVPICSDTLWVLLLDSRNESEIQLEQLLQPRRSQF